MSGKPCLGPEPFSHAAAAHLLFTRSAQLSVPCKQPPLTSSSPLNRLWCQGRVNHTHSKATISIQYEAPLELLVHFPGPFHPLLPTEAAAATRLIMFTWMFIYHACLAFWFCFSFSNRASSFDAGWPHTWYTARDDLELLIMGF